MHLCIIPVEVPISWPTCSRCLPTSLWYSSGLSERYTTFTTRPLLHDPYYTTLTGLYGLKVLLYGAFRN